MPSIKYKKKTYAGATFPVLEMTKAEYDALPEAKKMDGTVYMITDDTGGWEAERSTYDNSESGLSATNVQDALDELNSKLIKSCSDTQTTDANGFWKIPMPSNFHVLLGIIINSGVSGEVFTSLTKINLSFNTVSVKITEWNGNAIANTQMNCTIYYL